jgi:hypothetical protein
MIEDLFLRWVVTTLFVITAPGCLYGIAAGRLSRAGIVGSSLHALMAIAMVVMAWPHGADIPTTGLLLASLLATASFAAVAVVRTERRRTNAYHAMMMLAMAWMYAAMRGGRQPASSDVAGASTHHHSSSMPGMDMPGMDMPGMDVPATETAHHATGTPLLSTGLNLLFTIGFAVAGAWWLLWLFARRRTEPLLSSGGHLGIAPRATMAAGMAIMCAVML